MISLVPERERGWHGEAVPDGGLAFSRTLRGLTERRVIDGPLLRSSEARRLDQMAETLQETYVRTTHPCTPRTGTTS